MVPTTSGVRSPGGVGFNAEGDVFYTDNQGPWNGACRLKQLTVGGFVGHPDSFKWYKEKEARYLGDAPAVPKSNSRIMTEAKRIPQLVPPVVSFPYGPMGQSASGIDCDLSGGKFGPFEKQLFVGDQTHSTVMRCFIEKMPNGRYQGACFPFRAGFGSGNVPVRFGKDGSLFVGGTNRGWGSQGPKQFAVESAGLDRQDALRDPGDASEAGRFRADVHETGRSGDGRQGVVLRHEDVYLSSTERITAAPRWTTRPQRSPRSRLARTTRPCGSTSTACKKATSTT